MKDSKRQNQPARTESIAADIETSAAIEDVAVQAEMAIVSTRYLRVVALAFAGYYTLRGLSYLFSLPTEVAGLLGWPALAGAAYAVGLYVWVRRRTVDNRRVEGAIFSLGVLLIFNVFWNLYLTGSSFQLVQASLVIIAVGLGTSRFRLWLIQVLICTAFYLYALTILRLESWAPYITIAGVGVLLSYVAFSLRAPMMRERILLQLKLEDKTKKLRIANEAKDRFVANITHELRTPLTGVTGMMELLGETKLDEDQRFMLHKAQKSSDYLLRVINDILDFTSLEAGELQLNPTTIDLLELCSAVVSVFEVQAKSKDLELTLSMPELDKLLVRGDGVRIGQILLNFISNALKFTDKGQINILLEWIPAQNGGHAIVSVSDTGAGFNTDHKEALFNRFEQADASITRTITGTGLGLSICNDLADLMGGTITVTSEIGKGSCFKLQLALESGDEAEYVAAAKNGGILSSLVHGYASEMRNNTHSPAPNRGQTGSAPPQIRALLAEDNPINQLLVVRMLELEGLLVTLVKNGQEAVEAVDQASPSFDVIFMDVQMPVLDGVNATRIIRLRMAKPPPIVAVTANVMENDVAEYLDAGMTAVLGKPVKREQLRAVIKDVLGDTSQPAKPGIS